MFYIKNLFLLFLLLLSSCSAQKESYQQKASPINSIENQKIKTKSLEEIQPDLAKLNACEGEIDTSVSKNNSSIYPINNQQYLVEYLCFLGAYQGNYEYFLYDNSSSNAKITPLSLAVYEVDESGKVTRSDTKSIGGLPEYNTQEKTLTILTKYRGLGDCGSLAKYKWEGQKFNLLEYRVKADCDGTYLEPEKYSQVYP